MALIVEDGTGKADAEAYASVAQADTRLASLGLTNWATLTTTEKEQALRRATVYMEQAYRQRWKGTRLYRAQALSWPRYGVEADGWLFPSTEVPTDIANACADLALRALADDLNPDTTQAIKREKVGPLETEYQDYSAPGTKFLAVDMALSVYLRGGGSNVMLVRA